MNRPPFIVFFALFLLAGARSLGAQQINPRVPPPPPSAPAGAPPSAPATAPNSAPASASAPVPAPPPDVSQPIDPTVPPPPPSEDSVDEAPATPSGPVFDPLHAGRSLDIGKFYLNKGSYDAAIDRFVEASNYQPTLAAPWKLLGDAYEKKHEYAKAIESYNKYLQILPRAPDAAKIKKQISDLAEKAAQESPKKAER
jgi:tetratricopeptide (TPR) repeat protein